MKTVIETPTFTKQADQIWSEDERLAFIDYIVHNPTTGDVIKDADGARKIRWAIKGTGKSGGVRIIYFNLDDEGIIYLIAIYRKTKQANIMGKEIKKTAASLKQLTAEKEGNDNEY